MKYELTKNEAQIARSIYNDVNVYMSDLMAPNSIDHDFTRTAVMDGADMLAIAKEFCLTGNADDALLNIQYLDTCTREAFSNDTIRLLEKLRVEQVKVA